LRRRPAARLSRARLSRARLSRARLFRSIGRRRTALSTRWRRSCPSVLPGSSFGSGRTRPEGWGGLVSGTSIGPFPATLRGAERGIAAAGGARRPRSGAGLPARQRPGCGSFSFCSTPSAESIWPGSARRLRSFRGASVRWCGARSDIGAVCAAPRNERWPRSRCGTRLACGARTLTFLPPARSTSRWPGGWLPRRPARGARSGGCLPSCSGSGRDGWALCGWRLRSRRGCGPGPAEDGCGSGRGRRCSRHIRASRCLDLSRPGSLRRQGRNPCLYRSRRGSHLGELGQAVFQKVIGLRVHGQGVNLPRGRQSAHCFPHPRARGDGGEENLDLLAGGGVHRLQVHGDQERERGDLGSGAAGLERPAVTHAQHLPARRLTGFPQHRGDAQGLPQLAQGAQHRGLS
jgi:hypothetical protein